jgi:hypothetical protein
MIVVKIVSQELYYFQDSDIEEMAKDENCTVEECKAILLAREFDRDEIQACCGFNDYTIIDYEAHEE